MRPSRTSYLRLLFLPLLMVMLFLSPPVTQQALAAVPGDIVTIAGGGVGDNGPATSAPIAPDDVAVDASGNLYVADAPNSRVRKINTAGVITTLAGNGTVGYSGDNGPATKAALNEPSGLAVDAEGNVFIADSANHVIRKVDPSGTITTVAGSGTRGWGGDGGPARSADLNSPSAVAIGASGSLIIADRGNLVLRKVSSDGTITTIAGRPGQLGYQGDGGPAHLASMTYPTGVSVDSAGNIYFADELNHCIRKIDSAGIITTVAGNGTAGFADGVDATAGATLNTPSGVHVDSFGNIFIPDANNYRIRRVAPNGTISTVAGNGEGGYSGDGGPAVWAAIMQPFAVAVDGAGNLYLGEGLRVRKVDASGIITSYAGNGDIVTYFVGDGGPATEGGFYRPFAVAIDRAGNSYVADLEGSRVRKIDSSGTITTVAGDGTSGIGADDVPAVLSSLNWPSGVAVDAAGNLYIADAGNNRIRRVDLLGNVTTVAGRWENGGYNGDGVSAIHATLAGPSDVAISATGEIYIADTYNHRIRKVDLAGVISTVAGDGANGYNGDNIAAISASLSYPSKISFDAAGNLHFSDSGNGRVRKVDAYGTITTVAGNGDLEYNGDHIPAAFAALHPYGLAFDSLGNLYISDDWNNRIRKVDTSGIITTVAGTGTYGFSGDEGPAIAAALASPRGLAIDSASNLYVADSENGRIRMVLGEGGAAVSVDSGWAYTNSANVRLTLSCSTLAAACSEMQIWNDLTEPGSIYPFAASREWTLTAGDGLKTVYVRFRNEAGEWSQIYSDSITLDTIPPAVSITSPAGGTTTDDFPLLSYSITEGRLMVRLDGALVNWPSGLTRGPLDVGPHLVRVEATDAAGNVGVAEVPFTVVLPPWVTIHAPAAATSDPAPLLIYYADAGTVVVRVDGAVVGKVSGDRLDPLPDGSHTVSVEVSSDSGIALAEQTFTVDTVAPVVTITSPAALVTIEENRPVLNYTATEGTVKVRVDGVLVSKRSGERLGLANGVHTVEVEAIDQAGNRGMASVTFTIAAPVWGDDDFESGEFTRLPWDTSGDGLWTVTQPDKHGGLFSAEAPRSIIDNQRSTLQVTADCAAGNVSFWYAVSSEANFDFLHFYVDGERKGTWSGSIPWSSASFPVTAGTHTFRWEYVKYNSGSNGADTAWIDDVILPVKSYSITLDAGANGSIAGPVTAIHGDQPSYSFIPDNGYHVADVVINGVSVGAVTSYTFTSGITANATIAASFAIDTFTVDRNAGLNGAINGPAAVNYGGNAYYSITPAVGYHVADVVIDGASVGAVTNYSFSNVTANHTISASFEINSYNLAATAGDNGSISGPSTVTYGGSATYTITPAAGYHVADVLVDGASVGAVTSYSFSNVIANHTISASFEVNSYTVAATAGANGSISGPSTVNYGGSATYTITPAGGYQVIDVVVDGVSAGAVTSYTFANVTANHTIIASFAPQADLIVNSVAAPTSATRGSSISVSSSISNTGGAAGSFGVAFYLSKDNAITGSDTLLGTTTVTAVSGGSTTTVNGFFTVPTGLATGKYYVGVIVDSNSAISESNESNNTKAAGSTTTLK